MTPEEYKTAIEAFKTSGNVTRLPSAAEGFKFKILEIETGDHHDGRGKKIWVKTEVLELGIERTVEFKAGDAKILSLGGIFRFSTEASWKRSRSLPQELNAPGSPAQTPGRRRGRPAAPVIHWVATSEPVPVP